MWSVASALAYAQAHATGCNVDAIGAERAEAGNIPGAVRLCEWALWRANPDASVMPCEEIRAVQRAASARIAARRATIGS